MSFLRTLIDELRRRRVFRVVAGYAVAAWVVVQVANDTFPALQFPDWALTLVVVCALLGFPVALALAWAFDLTPEGVRRGRVYAGLAVLAIVMLAASAFFVRGRDAARSSTAGATVEAVSVPASIAVLPFADLSAAGDQEYFGSGLAEELLNVLARTEGLRVAARTSSFAFAGTEAPVTEIGAQLGVEAVLEGSVRESNGTIRITAQLIDARTGYHLWSDAYTRELSDVFAIQDEIAAAIANALELRLVGGDDASPRRARPRDPEAFQLYLRGRYAWNQRTLEGIRESVSYFEQALQLDPAYALAYTGLADAYMLLEDVDALSREEAFAKGGAAARRALQLDETLAEAHTSLAHILMHQLEYDESEREYLRALALNPNLSTAHQWYSLLLSQMQRWDEALEYATRAAELDPLSIAPARSVGVVLYLARRPDESVSHFEAVLERHPDSEELLGWLGWAHLQAGRADTASALWTRLRGQYGAEYYQAPLAAGLAASGRAEAARRMLTELEREFRGPPPYPFQIAIAYGYLSDLDRAFQWLDRAADDREPYLDFVEIEPAFDPLRGDRRFQAILRKTGHMR
ncbi:MAG TPA: tetratricopeptide repeat protein [Longimicrobiales bacterium]|nr:tetratricopeptide repeat protein [Longimicrobiales bacterium]